MGKWHPVPSDHDVPPGLHPRLPGGLPATLRELTAPCYLHRVAGWKLHALLGAALLVVVGGLAGIGRVAMRRGLDGPEIAFALFMLLFLAVLLRPSVWRSRIVMAADRRGIFLVGDLESAFVPWAEIGPMTIERAVVGSGVSRTVIVAIRKESSAWDAARRSAFSAWLLGDEHPPGHWRLPLGTQGIAPETTLRCLEALRHLSAPPGSPPA